MLQHQGSLYPSCMFSWLLKISMRPNYLLYHILSNVSTIFLEISSLFLGKNHSYFCLYFHYIYTSVFLFDMNFLVIIFCHPQCSVTLKIKILPVILILKSLFILGSLHVSLKRILCHLSTLYYALFTSLVISALICKLINNKHTLDVCWYRFKRLFPIEWENITTGTRLGRYKWTQGYMGILIYMGLVDLPENWQFFSLSIFVCVFL